MPLTPVSFFTTLELEVEEEGDFAHIDGAVLGHHGLGGIVLVCRNRCPVLSLLTLPEVDT